ncbi:MAG: hypothetical protein ACR5LB_06115 [Wolbachia sp.]|uniref:hypothetical protein n=1 Tax=unclassified Wolbachia TaxID=2640676 RepID=UPI002230559B|nr:hypothetical protein [Wolbachia endosymbiont (group A) of Calamotropha paludella]
MPSSGKFKVRVAKIIRETTSSKFDSLNTKMDEVDIIELTARSFDIEVWVTL